jgi:hypothetical protein
MVASSGPPRWTVPNDSLRERIERASRRIRTDDRLFTKQLLLPAELERHARGRSIGSTAPHVEQVTGIEPAGTGVAHRCATMTLHLLGGLHGRPGRRGARGRVRRRTWVGWESNPRFGGVRNRCKASVCYQPVGYCVVPPSGIEPEPLGLQPSAQTNYARVGCRAARPLLTNVRRCGGCLPRHPSSSSLFDCHRTPPCAARTSGLDASAKFAGAPWTSLHPRTS